MKKFMILAGVAAAMGLTACNGGASSESNGLDSLFSQKQADSLVIAVAQINGIQDNIKFAQVLEQDPTLSKADFLRGVKYILAADTTQSFAYGMYEGLNFLGQIKQWQMIGLKVDLNAYVSNFQKFLMADSIDESQSAAARQVASRLTTEMREAMQLLERARIEQSDEAVGNVQRSREYIDSVANADANVKVLASGVAYKLEQAGEGDNLTTNSRIKLKYSGRTLAGRVFERSPQDSELSSSPVAMRVRGLQEALTHLNKGAKATVYVPGKEAFGVDQNRYGVGPNEMVIYEVEILDVDPAK